MGKYINRAQMLLDHLRELRKVGNTRLMINGLANAEGKFYLLAPTKREFEQTIREAMLVDPTIKKRAIYLPIDKLNGFVMRRLPIAVDVDMIAFLLENILQEHFSEIQEIKK